MARINLGRDTSGRPLVIDTRTRDKLRTAEAALGFEFTIVQGSYRAGSGAAASAGTHDGGGVIDLRTWNLPASISPHEAVGALRRAGFIAWYRHRGQGFDPHIHAIDYGNPWLHHSAAAQVRMWEQGFNGLASWGRDDHPVRNIPKAVPAKRKAPKPKDWFDMASEADLRKIVREEIRRELNRKIKVRKLGGGKKGVPFRNVLARINNMLTKQEERDRGRG